MPSFQLLSRPLLSTNLYIPLPLGSPYSQISTSVWPFFQTCVPYNVLFLPSLLSRKGYLHICVLPSRIPAVAFTRRCNFGRYSIYVFFSSPLATSLPVFHSFRYLFPSWTPLFQDPTNMVPSLHFRVRFPCSLPYFYSHSLHLLTLFVFISVGVCLRTRDLDNTLSYSLFAHQILL